MAWLLRRAARYLDELAGSSRHAHLTIPVLPRCAPAQKVLCAADCI